MLNCSNKITLRSYLGNSNIFTSINNIKKYPFLEGVESDAVNMMLKISYGQKIVFSGVADLTPDDVAPFIVKTYGDKWDALLLTAGQRNNIAAGTTKVTSGSSSDSGTKTIDGINTHKASAYNSDELIVDNSDVKNDVETTSGKADKSGKEETVSIKNLFDNLPLFERTNIINIVLKDVSTYLTINIY